MPEPVCGRKKPTEDFSRGALLPTAIQMSPSPSLRIALAPIGSAVPPRPATGVVHIRDRYTGEADNHQPVLRGPLKFTLTNRLLRKDQ